MPRIRSTGGRMLVRSRPATAGSTRTIASAGEPGTAWLLAADVVVAYIDRGVSRGMQAEIDTAMGSTLRWRTVSPIGRSPGGRS